MDTLENRLINQEPDQEKPAEEKGLENFRQAVEMPKKNDITVGEAHAAEAKRLLYQMGAKFEMKRSLNEDPVEGAPEGTTVPGKFFVRLEDNSDGNAEQVFQNLRLAKLDVYIVGEPVDLDKEKVE